MQNDSLHTLLHRLNLNTLALERATKEIGDWIANAGGATISSRTSEHLETIENNSRVIANSMADLIMNHTLSSTYPARGNHDAKKDLR